MLRQNRKGKNVCLKEFTWCPVREKKSGRGRPFFSLPPQRARLAKANLLPWYTSQFSVRCNVWRLFVDAPWRGAVSRLPLKYLFGHTFLIMLVVSLLGCKQEPDGYIDDHKLNVSLIGTWQDNTAGDKYVITENHISYHGFNSYFMEPDIDYAGTIEYVSIFTDNAGVIIIKYDTAHRPTYYTDEHWSEDDGDHWMDFWADGEICDNPAHILSLKGDYIGIYYRDLMPGVSVKIGGAYIPGGAEESTLAAAKKAFTVHKESDYMGSYGTYTK